MWWRKSVASLNSFLFSVNFFFGRIFFLLISDAIIVKFGIYFMLIKVERTYDKILDQIDQLVKSLTYMLRGMEKSNALDTFFELYVH